MAEVVPLTRAAEVLKCGNCDSTAFQLLAQGVPICIECNSWLPVTVNPLPEWLKTIANEAGGPYASA